MVIHEIFCGKVSENKTKSEFSWGSRENFHFGNGFIDDYQGVNAIFSLNVMLFQHEFGAKLRFFFEIAKCCRPFLLKSNIFLYFNVKKRKTISDFGRCFSWKVNRGDFLSMTILRVDYR